ncbi:YfhO family protein [Anaeromyxobacter sp. SG64]|uniref:YfhO family protein n=1 Tax=Anaeromyxobacter sp. SG64 TaxID=2925409 RepID=UPI001F5A0964|nr:YfhO family protein [Anaeromyxobacter sp. SG64]
MSTEPRRERPPGTDPDGRGSRGPRSPRGGGRAHRRGDEPRGALPAFSRRSALWTAAIAGYLVYAAALLSPIWLQRVEPKWDAVNYFYPAFAFTRDALLDGRAPLWDPFTNCGLPFHADPQAPLLDPLALLLAPAAPSASQGFALYWSIHWAWAGLGALLLAFALGAGPVGGLVAAIAYAFSGFFVGNAQHTTWIVTASWLPWTFGLAHLALFRRSWGLALLAGAAAGLSALGGYPGLVSFQVFALALWLFAAAAASDARGADLWRSLARAAAIVAVVTVVLVAIWAPVLHAFLTHAAQYTDRAGPLPREVANYQNPFTLRAAVSLLFPRAVLELRDTFDSDVSMLDGYAGALALLLAAAWVRARGLRRAWWIVAFAALMFAVSLGGAAGVRTLLYDLVPPTRYMRHNAGFRIFWILPLAAAAGAGLTAIFRRAELRRWTTRAAVAWLAGAIALAVWVASALSRHDVTQEVVALALVPGLAVVALGCAAIAWAAGAPSATRARAGLTIVALLFAGDLAIHVHSQAKTVWTVPGAIAELERTSIAIPATARRLLPAEQEALGIQLGCLNYQQVLRLPVVEGYVTMTAQGFNDGLVQSRFAAVLAANRFWLSPHTSEAPPAGWEAAILSNVDADSPVPVLVDGRGPVLPGDPVRPGTYGGVRITSFAPERVVLDLDVPAGRGAVLASTERYAPGWSAEIDGAPAEVLRVNRWFRGAAVSAGRHRVVFQYQPRGWWPLVALSAIALVLSVVGGGALMVRNARRQPPSSVA